MRILAKKKIFSDEAHFDLGGYVNNQKCRICRIEKPTHPKRVTLWGRFWSRGIIEPFYLENGQREAVTVNRDRYQAMLNEFLFKKIED